MSIWHRFRHRWTAVAVDHYERGFRYRSSDKPVVTGYITQVLQRCPECGAVRSVELEGVWTLEQLT